MNTDNTFMHNSNDTENEPMLTSLQHELIVREEQLLALETVNIARDVIIKAIAHEEIKSKLPRARLNLAGIASLLKLLMSMDGVEKRLETDVDLPMPDDVEEALQYLIKARSEGKVHSVQANDIANLLEKRRNWAEMVELSKKVKELMDRQETDRIARELKISRREDIIDADNEIEG
jgi:uncharacterized protein YqgV (UPF0045/DUF77 family)